ncbi:hypothetical protein D3C87_904430 [compost metagenome]
MKIMTTIIPITAELIPASIAACPKVGPTTASSTILAVVGRRPAFNTFAKSFVSSTVNEPEIDELPFGISPLTEGAE